MTMQREKNEIERMTVITVLVGGGQNGEVSGGCLACSK